jgi:hypothetical protein
MSAAKKPLQGWKMTGAQAARFWREWAGVMRAQGWKAAESEIRRKEMLARLGFASLKDVDKTDGFDAVLKELLRLQDVVVNEAEDDGQRRRYVHRIGEQLAEFNEIGQEHYVEPILKDRFKVFPGLSCISDLSTEELRRAVMTLDARLGQVLRGPVGPASWIMPRMPRFRKGRSSASQKVTEDLPTVAPAGVEPAFACYVASTEPAMEEEPF